MNSICTDLYLSFNDLYLDLYRFVFISLSQAPFLLICYRTLGTIGRRRRHSVHAANPPRPQCLEKL